MIPTNPLFAIPPLSVKNRNTRKETRANRTGARRPKTMKVLLINPRMPVYLRTPSLPLGLLSIASYLQAHGHSIRFLEMSAGNVSLKKETLAFQPDVIGISTLSYLSSIDAKEITAKLRRWTAAPVIWGGQAPSALPEVLLRDGKADYLILGEGEVTWLAFVEAMEAGEDLSDIPGMAYLKEGRLVVTPQRPVADLTAFPDLDWSLVQPERYFSSFFNCTKMLYLHASKGCVADCSFCANKRYHQGCNRSRDPKQVMRDIECLVNGHGANGIYFSDELFLPKRSVRNELMEMLIEKDLDLVWGCQTRLGVLTKEDLRLMHRAGCRWILFGIESGCEERIREIRKQIDLSKAKQAVDWCKEIGITVQTSFIIGFPGETPQEMQQTIDLAEALDPNLVVMNILIAFPNSDIYDRMVAENPDFHPPQTIRQMAKKEQVASDQVTDNLSRVPTRELHVVHYFFQWKAFAGKDSVEDESFGIVKKMAGDALNRIFRHGLKGFVFGTYHSVRQFCTVFFYSHFFPGILKKYRLK